jgi:hypothetical protein
MRHREGQSRWCDQPAAHPLRKAAKDGEPIRAGCASEIKSLEPPAQPPTGELLVSPLPA